MRGPGQEKAPPPTDTEKRFKNEKNDLDLGAAFAEFLCVRSNPGDGIFLLMLQLNKLVCCSKGWTSLRCFFKCFHYCCSKGLDQPALFFLSSPDAYREVPLVSALLSSSKSLVWSVSIASSLMRRRSWFFSVSDKPPSF